jgi:hypothetical protein
LKCTISLAVPISGSVCCPFQQIYSDCLKSNTFQKNELKEIRQHRKRDQGIVVQLHVLHIFSKYFAELIPTDFQALVNLSSILPVIFPKDKMKQNLLLTYVQTKSPERYVYH